MITEDLRDSGRFDVVDYDEEIAKSLVNGNQLVRDFNAAFEYLMQHYVGEENVDNVDNAKEPSLKRKPHGPDFSGETAIKNMFLLQVPVDRKEGGRLVIGDVDHVCMFYYRAPHS